MRDLIKEELEGDQSGVEIDYFGNKISWLYSDSEGLITFYIDDKEITCWSIEIEPELAVIDFMKIYGQMAVRITKRDVIALAKALNVKLGELE